MRRPKFPAVDGNGDLCAQYRWALPNCRTIIANNRKQVNLRTKSQLIIAENLKITSIPAPRRRIFQGPASRASGSFATRFARRAA